MPEHRYRADTRVVYAMALVVIVKYARAHSGEFFYGPKSLERLENEGLLVSGPVADKVAEALSKVVGLVEVEA